MSMGQCKRCLQRISCNFVNRTSFSAHRTLHKHRPRRDLVFSSTSLPTSTLPTQRAGDVQDIFFFFVICLTLHGVSESTHPSPLSVQPFTGRTLPFCDDHGCLRKLHTFNSSEDGEFQGSGSAIKLNQLQGWTSPSIIPYF